MEWSEITGRIFDIQRFSIHDGPGIRTTVFLKGCVLRCRWCCNPESQNYQIEETTVDGVVHRYGRDVTVAEVLETVKKDRPYYYRSGGGMTLSGGESLCQPEFAKGLLAAAKEAGIHTAMESTACAAFETIEEILPFLDLYLLDIKHMDSAKHQAFTKQPNEQIQANARKIAAGGMTELVIRIPVIPDFNATVPEIRAIAEFAAGLPGVRRIHLLPYHRLGQDKYERLGREYGMKGVLPLGQDQMEEFLAAAKRASGLDCQLGG